MVLKPRREQGRKTVGFDFTAVSQQFWGGGVSVISVVLCCVLLLLSGWKR